MKIENFNYKNHSIEIHIDDCPFSPRENDNLGIIHAWHKRMNIGDEGYNYNLYSENEKDRLNDNLKEAKQNNDIVYPLYAYEHGNISLSLGNSHYPFNDRWDAGQVGFIIVKRDKILEEFGKKRLSKKLKQKVKTIIELEIETYNQYINGDIYGYEIKDNQDNLIDSLWGIYGIEDTEEEAKGFIDNIDNTVSCI